jgi:hypothetical protein
MRALTGFFINTKYTKLSYKYNPLPGKNIIPVDIVLVPEWWYKNEKITFEGDFLFHPLRRTEEEKKMESILLKWMTTLQKTK